MESFSHAQIARFMTNLNRTGIEAARRHETGPLEMGVVGMMALAIPHPLSARRNN